LSERDQKCAGSHANANQQSGGDWVDLTATFSTSANGSAAGAP